MLRFAGFIFAVLLSTISHAKCAYEIYDVGGVVTKAADASPITGAEIVITWNELGGATSQTLAAKTNAIGRYRSRIRFYPWSGMTGSADKCQAKLTNISLKISASGFESEAAEQTISGSATTANYSLRQTTANRHDVD